MEKSQIVNIAFPIQTPITVISAGQFRCNEKWIHTERVINSFELIIGVEEELYLQQGSEQYVIRPGNVMLVLPGLVHRGYQMCKPGTSFFWMHFLPSEYTTINDEESLSTLMLGISRPTAHAEIIQCLLPVFAPLKSDDKLDILFYQLLHVSRTPYYTDLLKCNFSTALLIQVCQNYLDYLQADMGNSHSNRTFETILEYVRAHCHQKMSVTQTAERFGYNTNYFSHIFKLHTGICFSAYVNLQRVNRAKLLLYRTNLSVKEIAGQIGFEDEKYFMKVFHKYENLTPSQYRDAFYLVHSNTR